MRLPTIPALAAGALWVLPASVLTRISVPAAALFAVLGLAWARLGRGPWPRAGLLALPAFLAGLPWPSAEPPRLPPGPVVVAGTVRDVVHVPATATWQVFVGETGELRLHCDTDPGVLPGDRLRVLANVAEGAAPGWPAHVQAVPATATVTPGPWSVQRAAAAARLALERALLRHLPVDDGALVAALVLGRTTRPDAELVAAHRATGLSHLLAVSGAHAAMLAFLLGLCTWHGRTRVGRSGRSTAVVLGLLVVYAAITGCEPPVLRAVVAYTFAATAHWLGRPCGVAPTLLAPAILTAFVQPAALLGPSFLLSYAAVAGLVLAGAPRGDTFTARWVIAPLRASFWATLLTAPLTLWFFGQLAPWTVLLTPLLAPLVGTLLLLGLCTAVAGVSAPPLASMLAVPTGAVADLYGDLVHMADRLPGTPIPASCEPSPWLLLLAAWTALALVALGRNRRATALGAVLLGLPHFVPLPRPRPRFVLCAVGHGQAGLVTTADGHQTAIDCGSLQAPFRAADALVAELHPHRLDLLVVTHADLDHHGGIAGLLGRVPIARAVVPEGLAASAVVAALRAHGTEVDVVRPGCELAPAEHLRVWAPPLPPG
ncbi:MAG: ComEC/Rec2 family competence protein, partial [Planctomycetes bacterium]|nr:ComEC/Rec2 family competence protein [Planctomycetota bacterium]